MISKRSLFLAVALVGVSVAVSGVRAQSALPLIQPSDVVHIGSFTPPLGLHAGGSADMGYEYGTTALAFNPASNSLFVVGHDWDQFTGEINIPASLSGSATVRQNLTDAFNGQMASIGSGTAKVGGNLVYKGQLYMTAFLYYDGTGAQTASHFVRSLTLGSGSVSGPMRAGSLGAGYYSGYMTTVPAEWQSAFGAPALTGNCCLSVISRTSYGPAAFAFDPEDIGSATPLVYYTQAHQTLGAYGAGGSHPTFNGTTKVKGIVFPPGTSTVLFVGRTGTGNYCYGEAAACNDPSNTSKGEHAYPYAMYAWAYNANDLVAVRNGQKQPWDVVPYAVFPLGGLSGDNEFSGGAAYDPATKRLYVAVAGSTTPTIHVFSIKAGSATPAPQAPSNLRVTN